MRAEEDPHPCHQLAVLRRQQGGPHPPASPGRRISHGFVGLKGEPGPQAHGEEGWVGRAAMCLIGGFSSDPQGTVPSEAS